MKKIFLFLCVVFLLVLPVVSADNDTYYVGENTTADGHGTVDDPYNNLNLALNSIGDNDIILINGGVYGGENNNDLTITSNNLLILANGDVTLTGGNIFTNDANNVTLSGIKFVNCTKSAIVNNKYLNIYNSSFFNNVAPDSSCVDSAYNATINIDSCLFVGNTATEVDAAVSCKGFGTVINSTFIGNHANRDGGAIRSHGAIFSVDNCTFINNTASGHRDDSYGGAIYQWIGTLNITNCIFINNSAADCGGAIHLCKGRMTAAYSNISVSNNIFIDNYAKYGGAIYLEGCKGDVFNNAFINNTKNTVYLSDYFIQYFNSTINDNWWGENSPDWNKAARNMNPPSSIVTLNLTVGTNVLKVNESTEVAYDFYVGDKKADIPQRDIVITSSGGNLVGNTFSSSAEGKFTITASADNENNAVEVLVSDNPAILSVDDVDKYFGSDKRLIVNLTDSKYNPIANATVTVKINNNEYARKTNAEGIASVGINLNPGVYDVVTTYGLYCVNSTVAIESTVNGSDIVKVFQNQTQYYATFLDSDGNYLSKGSTVTFNINGVFYNRTVGENGLSKLNINLAQGSYIITAMNLKTGENASNNITVLSKIIGNTDLVKFYRNDSQYCVMLVGDDGKTAGANESVTFNINGVFYTRFTNESGIAKLNINLRPGKYIITCECGGCMVSNNITVLDVLNASDMVKAYGTSNQFHASLVDGMGNPYSGRNITFNINGVFYTRITNASGIASLNINLHAGEYIISSVYEGYAISNIVKVEDG